MLDDAILRAGGTIALNPQDFDLVGALRGLCEDFQKRSPSHALSMLCDEIELFGQWDGPRLERAFSNLLENAVKYSPDGGAVTVRIVRERRVDGGFEAVVQVQDTGVGIPPRALPRIFDRLYRADNVAAAFKGSGLGLTGVRSIVEAHAGTIGVESVEGEGTTFTVRLPCHRVADDGRGDGALEVSGASST
jgi:signal transduction histidine kinase